MPVRVRVPARSHVHGAQAKVCARTRACVSASRWAGNWAGMRACLHLRARLQAFARACACAIASGLGGGQASESS
eukprot:4401818-Alexandrium_andersonii.AAC.1